MDNNVEYTDKHLDALLNIGHVDNLTLILQKLKNIKFPTKERIEFAEQELANLAKKKNRFLYNDNHKGQKSKTKRKW